MGGRGWKEEVAWEGVGRNKREPGREWAGKREGLLRRRWEEERAWEGEAGRREGLLGRRWEKERAWSDIAALPTRNN